jgi:tetratricopeptide (TPR) repeat protein
VWFQTRGTHELIRNVTWIERILGACAVPWFYLYKAILPINLSFVYPQWEIRANEIRWWLPLMASATVTGYLFFHRHTRWGRSLLFAWLFYCIALLPVCGLVDVYFMKYSLVADHYGHIAIVGVSAIVAALFCRIPTLAASATAGVVVALLAVLTYHQAGLYHDEMTLYSDTLKKNPDAWMAHVNLGLALEKSGQTRDAIDHYRTAVRLAPEFGPAWYDLGVAELELRKPAAAVESLRRAVELMQHGPDFPQALNNLGAALLATGRADEAALQFQRALELRPEYISARVNLRHALAKAGRRDQTRR